MKGISMATSQTILSRDQIRVLALRALVKERGHRILRRQRHYELGGAICWVATAATRGTGLSQSKCFAAIKAECERLLSRSVISEAVLLQAAQEWEALPIKDRLTRSIIVTPTFASLISTCRRHRQTRQVAASEESPALF